MTTQRILVVDDEDSILRVLDYALKQEGFEVVLAHDAEETASVLAGIHVDLVVLDVMLPGVSGLEIARELRARSNVPIIMLSARGEEVDRILGLEFGADDYVTKPFSPRELVSRIRAILRRAGAAADDHEVISLGDLEIDPRAREVRVAGTPVRLTGTEYALLVYMGRRAGAALSRAELIQALHEETAIADERAIDVHVHNIREKLEPDPKEPVYLLTVRGFGYRLSEP